MIAATIAWDDDLSWSWQTAINALRATLAKVPSCVLCVSHIQPHFKLLQRNLS